jgi:hypothetical protein
MKYFFCIPILSFGIIVSNSDLNNREKMLIGHVENSIAKGLSSRIDRSLPNIVGMTSSKIKHLLNNLCSLDNCRYLEIGVWKGATFTSALYKNTNIISAVAIDNWSEWGGPKNEFEQNCACIKNIPFTLYEEDCFKIDITKLFTAPVDIYFYDGNHTEESQEKAFTYFDPILASSFIAIIDDWRHVTVPVGTRRAFEKLNYTILYEQALLGHGPDEWHNGFYVAVIRRNVPQ